MGKKLPKWKKLKKNVEIVRTWQGQGWIAQVVENEDGGGWAVTMTREGDDEPVYVAPWTMGRNKVDPKPLNQNAFNTWVKSASEFLMRSQHQIRTANRSSFTVFTEDNEPIKVVFDIEQDDYMAEGVLIAYDTLDDEIARSTVDPQFKLTLASAEDWVNSDFETPTLPETILPQQDNEDFPEEHNPEEHNPETPEEYLEGTPFTEEVMFTEEVIEYEDDYVEPDEGPTFDYDE